MNYVKMMINQWIKEHENEVEKAKKQIAFYEEVIERENNYITYLKNMIKEN